VVPELRRAQPGDAADVLRLLRQIADLHHAGRPDLFKQGIAKYTIEQFEAILLDADRPVFVAVDDRRVVGYCFCIVNRYKDHPVFRDHTSLYVDDLCVDRAHRGSGLGKKLFAEVLAYANDIGAQCIDLNVWQFNESAIAFYQSCGFLPRSLRMECKL